MRYFDSSLGAHHNPSWPICPRDSERIGGAADIHAPTATGGVQSVGGDSRLHVVSLLIEYARIQKSETAYLCYVGPGSDFVESTDVFIDLS